MNIILKTKEKQTEIDCTLDQEAMEVSDFQFSLEELSQYLTGTIYILFSDKKKIHLDLFFDFSLCLDDILDSIKYAKFNTTISEEIWFLEQGSDFYINYKIDKSNVIFEYKKGDKTGYPNSDVDEFTVIVDKDEYIMAWECLFQNIIDLIAIKSNKKISSPLIF